MTPIEPLQVSEVVERLEDIALGYECSALIERGVMEHLKPEVEAWRAKDVTPRTMRMRMRLVRENASSISNERTCRTSAETLRAAISSIRTLQSENEALRAAGEEARRALEPLLQDPSRTNWASPTTGWFRLASKAHRGLEEVLGDGA